MEKYTDPALMTLLPDEAIQPLSRIAFNQQGEFVFSITKEIEEDGPSETDLFLFDSKTQKIKPVLKVKDLVNSLQFTNDHHLIFENFIGENQTKSIYSYRLGDAEPIDNGKKDGTNVPHHWNEVESRNYSFSRIPYPFKYLDQYLTKFI